MSEPDVPAIYLQIDEPYTALVDSGWIQSVAQLALETQSATDGSTLSIVITNEEIIHRLNRTFRGIDKPTDVLSFPSGEIDPDTRELNLGDVIIAYPEAAKQAAAGNYPVRDELSLLVVHGVLHLLGFDHGDDDEKTEMWIAQDEILTKLGINISPP